MSELLRIATSVEIAAPISRVWQVLTAFNDYGNWNPVLTLQGAAIPGTRVRARAGRSSSGREFEAWVKIVEPPTRLVWEGGDPEQFYGRHVFELAELDVGGTRLDNIETFSGKMTASVLEQHRDAIRSEFLAFNEALRAAAERD